MRVSPSPVTLRGSNRVYLPEPFAGLKRAAVYLGVVRKYSFAAVLYKALFLFTRLSPERKYAVHEMGGAFPRWSTGTKDALDIYNFNYRVLYGTVLNFCNTVSYSGTLCMLDKKPSRNFTQAMLF